LADPTTTTRSKQAENLLEVLRHSGVLNVERPRQVYCNRDINLGDVGIVGFDMDYTLALYDQDAIERLTIDKTLERLVGERGYPEEILELDIPTDFAIRGLVLDTERGNIFKLDSHRHVGKVYHGFQQLSGDDLQEYRINSMRMTTPRYALIDTLFALPEAALYAALVDYCETAEPTRDHDWKRLYRDIRYCVDLAHRDNSIKDEIIADTDHYLQRNVDLALTLHKFRSAGKKLFVLTNSYATFTDHILSYLLDDLLPEYPKWQNYFDIIITGANKPEFFTDRHPFKIVDTDETVLGEEFSEFDGNTIYQGGNLVDFERISGFRGNRVLFVGDHIYGDIVRSKKSSAWRTVMIVQEMERELEQSAQLREENSRLESLELEIQRVNEEIAFDRELLSTVNGLIDDEERDADDLSDVGADELRDVRNEIEDNCSRLRRRRRDLLDEILRLEGQFESQFNPYWGLLFKQGNKNSIFGEQVDVYACLYTSRVENFVHYSPMHYFRAPRQPMPHERY